MFKNNHEFIETTLGDISTFQKSYSFSREMEGEGIVRHIHYGDIHKKLPIVIRSHEILPTIIQDNDFQLVRYGDILIADASEDYKDLGKAVCYLDDTESPVISGLHTHRFNIDNRKVIPEYIINIFQTHRYRKFVWRMGTGVSVLGLSKSNLEKFPIYIPSIEIQKKVASFFNLINKNIYFQQEKIILLKEQKKGYMQKIFSKKFRFKDLNGESFPDWQEKLVIDILKLNQREVDKPTNSYMRLGLRSHAKGTFHELVSNVESVSMDKLYEVHEGDFIINITFAWEQALAVADETDHGKLVSHRFPTYVFKENHHKDFYKYFFTTKYFKYCLGNASPGGAGRNRVLNKGDFMNIQVNIPTYDEQVKISSFLSDLDKKILLEEQKLELLQQKKQAFMQQMFI